MNIVGAIFGVDQVDISEDAGTWTIKTSTTPKTRELKFKVREGEELSSFFASFSCTWIGLSSMWQCTVKQFGVS